jgi:hypothetical protein
MGACVCCMEWIDYIGTLMHVCVCVCVCECCVEWIDYIGTLMHAVSRQGASA